jgi:anti-sigma-K factor RskA
MAHLTPEQILDIADGTRRAAEFPHVSSCTDCAARVEEIARTIALAAEVDVPEPSPLFWDHLSDRIRHRVAQEAPPEASWWPTFASPWRAVLVSAAAVVLVLAVGMAVRRPVSAPETPTAVAVPEPAIVESLVAIDDDPALALLADLSTELDWDAASEAGLVPAHGTVDNVLVALTGEERNELQRILEEALAAAGA